MSTTFVSWKTDVWPKCACPEHTLINAVREAVIEFCEQTLLWSETLTAISVVADTQTYSLTSPYAYAEILGVDGKPKYKQDGLDNDQYANLEPISENEYDLYASGAWEYAEATVPAKAFVDIINKQIHLVPIPTEASTSGLLVKAILRPTISSTETSDFIYKDYRKVITFGALAFLLSQKEMPWYEPQAALVWESQFRKGYNEAKWKRITGAMSDVPMRVRFRKQEFA